jgi:hypothetical protein
MDSPGAGQEALAAAIVAAARAGFRVPEHCRWRAEHFNVAEIVSVELSLVELAARAYLLTGVQIDPGPRLEDPDPWELLKRTLEDRDVPACITPRAALTDDSVEVLRLGRARVHPEQSGLRGRTRVMFAAGSTRRSSPPRVRRSMRASCGSPRPLRPATPPGRGQRAIEMEFTCPAYDRERFMREPGLSLHAGFGDTPVYAMRPVHVTVTGEHARESFTTALAATSDPASAFPAELQRHGLVAIEPIVDGSPGAIVVELHDQQIIIRSPNAERTRETVITDHPALSRGPFSWSGFPEQPRITCQGNQVTIDASPAALSPDDSHRYEPTAMFALMHTITWAANVLQSGSCQEARQPLSLVPRFRAPPSSLRESDRQGSGRPAPRPGGARPRVARARHHLPRAELVAKRTLKSADAWRLGRPPPVVLLRRRSPWSRRSRPKVARPRGARVAPRDRTHGRLDNCPGMGRALHDGARPSRLDHLTQRFALAELTPTRGMVGPTIALVTDAPPPTRCGVDRRRIRQRTARGPAATDRHLHNAENGRPMRRLGRDLDRLEYDLLLRRGRRCPGPPKQQHRGASHGHQSNDGVQHRPPEGAHRRRTNLVR